MKYIILSLFIFSTSIFALSEEQQKIINTELDIKEINELCINNVEGRQLYKDFVKEQIKYRLIKYRTSYDDYKYLTALERIKEGFDVCTR